MKKVKIGIDTHAKNLYLTNVEAKKKRFEELLDYCQQFVSIENIKAFSEAPNEYFKKAFNDKFENDFPPLVNYSKRLELCGINEAKIQQLESMYSGIEIFNFDPEKMEAPDKDFNIYAIDSEAEKRYKKTKTLCDLLNELRSEQTIFPANIIQGLSGSIAFSFQTNQFEINVNYVNQIRSRAY
jgi:hypothetical protein